MVKHRTTAAGGKGGAGGGSKASSRQSNGKFPASKSGIKSNGGNAPATQPAKKPEANSNDHQQQPLPFAHQQRVLDVFSRALGSTLASPHLTAALQAVKRALFERDFEGAFNGNQQPDEASDVHPLDAYAARWSPTRALCYAAILRSPLVQEHWAGRKFQSNVGTTTATTAGAGPDASALDSTDTPRLAALRMVAIGGGAAEAVAFGSVLANRDGAQDSLVLVDSGPWANVVDKLSKAMTTPPDERRPALVEPAGRLDVTVRQQDILQVDDEGMKALLVGDSSKNTTATNPTTTTTTTTTLVTLFFTLNELFTAGGVGPAATFLLRLTAASPTGTVLLIADSPGSYAEASVGAQARRYPMRWLLDKILLQDASGSANVNGSTDTKEDNTSTAWTKVHQDDAIWFRLPASLAYPIRLEDMRYQVHLYVRR